MKRGVRVRIILPGANTDAEFVRRASRAQLGPTARRPARRSTSTSRRCIHCKVLIVDGLLVVGGLDQLRHPLVSLNDEANLNVYDKEFAHLQAETFDADLQKTRQITYEQWENRSWHEKLKEHAAAIFSSQL